MLKACLEVFQNNGKLRGLLYVSGAMLAVVITLCSSWAENPPKNKYEVIGAVAGILIAGINTLRSYLDQHLSRNPPTDAPKVG